MINPFVVPQREQGDKRPLCPWKHPEHGSYFVSVDHSEDAFKSFCDKIGDPMAAVGRHITVVAVGDEGCGKTSLVHRCAAWFSGELDAAGVRSPIVDLSAEVVPGLASEARLAHWTARLVDRIALNNLLDGEVLKELTSRKSDPYQALPFLADVLEQISRTMHVILPGIEILAEAEGLVGLGRPHLVFYTETSSDHVRRALGTHAGLQSVIGLEVGVLTIEDGWKFVEARLATAQLDPNGPVLEKATVQEYMRERIGGRGTTTIRELNLICQAVFSDAQKNARRKIEFDDFSRYYLRNGDL